jgi:hypothetical protein
VRPHLQNNQSRKDWRYGSGQSDCLVPSSNPSTAKEEEEDKKEEEEELPPCCMSENP